MAEATEQDVSEQRGVDATQGRGHQRDVRGAGERGELDVGSVETGVHHQTGAADERPGEDREPADVV